MGGGDRDEIIGHQLNGMYSLIRRVAAADSNVYVIIRQRREFILEADVECNVRVQSAELIEQREQLSLTKTHHATYF